MLLYLFSIFIAVYGQLSVDELFFFNSKYTLTGNCSDFQYNSTHFRINPTNYNQLIFNCNSSSLIFRNQDQISSLICPNNNDYFRIHFHNLSLTSLQVNQIHLHGIELCSLDDLIRSIYHEYSYYRSQRALLINLENTHNSQEQHHLAITTNGEMTFILFLLSSEYNTTLIENEIELIFPNENIFKFNRSSINVWRIDQGYVRIPKSLENSIIYQLSKSEFTLFNNETFILYGTQLSNPRRLLVSIDKTSVTCKYNYLIQCTFPILPLNLHDTDEPILKVIYNGQNILNTTLKLIPRTRLNRVGTNHSVTDIETFKVNIDQNICANESLKSLFTFIIHLWKEDINGAARYEKIPKNDMTPVAVDCNTTAEIGQEIKKMINSTSIDEIISMDVDLIHEWYNHRNCQAEKTRISFI